MIYLVDINVLVGLSMVEHQLHFRVRSWVADMDGNADQLATSAITELGLVRIIPQMTRGLISVAEAQRSLIRVKVSTGIPFIFLADELGADRLPTWVKSPSQTTDGHLLELARAHKAVFATCDENIPGSFVIPRL